MTGALPQNLSARNKRMPTINRHDPGNLANNPISSTATITVKTQMNQEISLRTKDALTTGTATSSPKQLHVPQLFDILHDNP
jgi:hypothetical protein